MHCSSRPSPTSPISAGSPPRAPRPPPRGGGDARPRRPARAARDLEAAQGMKPYSEASERNRAPILAVLKRIFIDRKIVLEVGSGTGQHAAYFAPELAHLRWQASDVAANL